MFHAHQEALRVCEHVPTSKQVYSAPACTFHTHMVDCMHACMNVGLEAFAWVQVHKRQAHGDTCIGAHTAWIASSHSWAGASLKEAQACK